MIKTMLYPKLAFFIISNTMKIDQKKLILDKSYLQGYNKKHILDLCKSYKLLISGTLIYEILKDEKMRSSLFFKLPPGPKYSEYIPSISELIKEEIEKCEECGKPSEHIVKRNYSVLRRFRNPHVVLSQPEIAAIKLEKEFLSTLLIDGHLGFMGSIFKKYNKPEISKELTELNNGKINDFSFMNNYLKAQRNLGANIPRIKFFTENSITYRYYQAMLIFSFDTCNRYANFETITNSERAVEKIRHDINDMSYMILSLLEGGFAVKEEKLKLWWNLLKKPDTPKIHLQT
ncbi:hypothetical protein RBH89_11010 [Paracidovorax avenae]